MKLLSYRERENLKRRSYATAEDIDRAHWHRFLEFLYDATEVPDNVQPDFLTYRIWKNQFPGWTHGAMTPNHPAWKREYKNQEKPMNELYRKLRPLLSSLI